MSFNVDGSLTSIHISDSSIMILDHLLPHLPLWEVVQDLHSTDPNQKMCLDLDHADYADPIWQHELDYARSGIDLPWKVYIMQVEIDDLREVWKHFQKGQQHQGKTKKEN